MAKDKEKNKKGKKGNQSKQSKGGSSTEKIIERITKEINLNWDRLSKLEYTSLELSVSIGSRFIKLKELVRKNKDRWGNYVEDNFAGITLRTAQRYMMIARTTPLNKVPSLKVLGQSTVLRMIRFLDPGENIVDVLKERDVDFDIDTDDKTEVAEFRFAVSVEIDEIESGVQPHNVIWDLEGEVEYMGKEELLKFADNNNIELSSKEKGMPALSLCKIIREQLDENSSDDDNKKFNDDEDEDGEKEDLDDMEKDELIDFMKSKGIQIRGFRKMDEDDLREEIEDALDDLEYSRDHDINSELEDLEDMDKNKLIEYIKDKGLKIKGFKKMDEDDLLEAIEKALKEPKRNKTADARTNKGGSSNKKPNGPKYTIETLERSQKNFLKNLSRWIDSVVTVKQKDLKNLEKLKNEIIEKIEEIKKACRKGKRTRKKG